MPKLSLIIPINNDLKNGFIKKQLELFSGIEGLEVIYVDGGSDDGTKEHFLGTPFQFIELPNSNRAQRINKGLSLASSPFILIMHPRSFIQREALSFLHTNISSLPWGGFTHRFDRENLLLAFTSWYSNNIRAKIKEIIYLDHCIFINRNYIPLIELDEVDIFEDTCLSLKLADFYRPKVLPFYSVTSSIRFNQNGVLKQSFLNQLLKVCWFLKLPHEWMNRYYEKGLELNQSYGD